MSQATNKKLIFPLSNISNYYGVWCPTNFIALRFVLLIFSMFIVYSFKLYLSNVQVQSLL